ncbi:MAG: hypothetical protein HQM14_08345 [SAR324 cluster bacterium]|nr:hypothetical protein [SAR324 cluster bacterium]
MLKGDKTAKVKLPQTVWDRLNYYAKQNRTDPETAIERLLERHLPNLMSGFLIALEKLSREEQQLMEESFYFVLYLISYADKDVSLKETLTIEQRFDTLKSDFGQQMVQTVGIDKAQKIQLLDTVKAMSSEDVLQELEKIHAVFDKMPTDLIEEYKTELLDSCIAVAEASREGVFSGERVSEEELIAIQSVVRILELPVSHQHVKALPILEEFKKNG